MRFERKLRSIGISLGPEKLGTLEEYVGILLEWNRKVNLISRKDEENVWGRHILHSLSLLSIVDVPPGVRVLDLGSGGGLPGIPLAVALTDVRVTLLDSIRKKCVALQDIVARLSLSNVEVVNGRAEEMSSDGRLAGKFDVVVARAVGPLTDLVKWSRPFLRRGGNAAGAVGDKGERRHALRPPALIAFKGGDLEEELEAARIKTGVEALQVLPLPVMEPGGEGLEEKKLVIALL